LSYNKGSITIHNSFDENETELTLKFIPAFACNLGIINVNVTETTLLRKKLNIKATAEGDKRITLYPSLKKKIKLSYKLPKLEIPKDALYFGQLDFKSYDGSKEIAKLPILIKQ
jgi:hypothetical protein